MSVVFPQPIFPAMAICIPILVLMMAQGHKISNPFVFLRYMVKTFYFNELRTCCYILSDKNGRCAIVDPGCCSVTEQSRLAKYIEENNLTPEMVLLTHGHFDHMMGCGFVLKKWEIPMYMNTIDISQINRATSYGAYFGYTFDAPASEPVNVEDGGTIEIGDISLAVRHTPGHSRGSVIYYNEKEHYVLTGDSLFAGSVGRTDLPEGDYDDLYASLKNIIMVLPPDTDVFPGHGPVSTIATEANTNPFLDPIR